jgi:uncharacterized protein YecT (DUF1311 family)
MKRRAVAVVLAALASSASRAQAAVDFSGTDAKLKTCIDRNPGNPGAADCEAVAFAAADRRLNQVYAGVLDALKHPGPRDAPYEPEIVERLVASERAWIAFRDAQCAYESSVAFHAPLEGYEYVSCRYEQTKARAKVLTAPEAPQNAR